MVMEYIEGETFHDMIQRRGPIPAETAIPLFKQALLGIGYAHRMGIVHRDIKPSNIMLTSDGEAALTDFGLASGRAYTVLTRPGQVLGTLDYIAPELIAGRAATSASDIYSLSCVLYELVAGQAPFAGKSIYEVAVAHLEDTPPDPSKLVPGLPKDVGVVLLYGLTKEPNARPRTATALARLLEAAVRA